MTQNEKNAARNAMAHSKNGLNGRDRNALRRLSSPSSADERLLRARAISSLREASRDLSGAERRIYNLLKK
ncbi:MAG: hypothetical protein IJ660_08080 [Alphaproteobacteria bacterium]|nr:hypothetical protein [Alphaproteobacteria bacterium]